MTRFAKPETVACPQCDWYFARPVLLSYNTFACKVYSDGSASDSAEEYNPSVGRCPSCNFVIDNVNDLIAIPEATEPRWVKKLAVKLSGKDLDTEYEYLPKPTFSDYAELFANTDTLVDKRNWAIAACRAYHQKYCLPAQNTSEVQNGDNKHASDCNNQPSKLDKVLYQDMSDFVLNNPVRPMLDEYTLVCADIYRLRSDFTSAILEYNKVTNPELKEVAKQGHKWCIEHNANLMELRL